jgi:hypothetical protein
LGIAYRRTVVLSSVTNARSDLYVVEVTTEPWFSYISLISGQCHDKFAIWQ